MSPANIWIKICGNTSLADAKLAADSGADAVGFVFAASPRRVTPEQVAAIIPHLPATLEKIGVFVDASFEEIEATVLTSGLTGVQLHFDAEPALAAKLRQRFGPALRILRVIHFGAEIAPAIMPGPNVDAILIDSRNATSVGGTGQTFDWALASKTLFQNAAASKLVAAGGLSPENVAQAIATLRPWGVDVVSGVEASPGRKDPAKVQAFIANARRTMRS
jgi:phosphoribosylanthranilate isomerase